MNKATEIPLRIEEESRLVGNWLQVVEQCLPEEYATLFTDALRRARISTDDYRNSTHLSRYKLDIVFELIHHQYPEITLNVFNRLQLFDLGLIGYAAVSAGTIGGGLRVLQRYHEFTTSTYNFSVLNEGDETAIRPIPHRNHLKNHVLIAEDCLAGLWRAIQLLGGDNLPLNRACVNFAYGAPDYSELYEKTFGCPVVFKAQRTELRFPTGWLELPIDSTNQPVSDFCSVICDQVMGDYPDGPDIITKTKRLLIHRPGQRIYRVAEAAAALGLAPIQFRKRLYRAGTNYKRVVLETRMELAQHYLQTSLISIQEIASLLDYEQPSQFCRAVKTYYGRSASAFRTSQ
jgi:AraC-like DNA-binding protein